MESSQKIPSPITRLGSFHTPYDPYGIPLYILRVGDIVSFFRNYGLEVFFTQRTTRGTEIFGYRALEGSEILHGHVTLHIGPFQYDLTIKYAFPRAVEKLNQALTPPDPWEVYKGIRGDRVGQLMLRRFLLGEQK